MFDLVIPGMCVQVATKALLKETAYHCSVLPSDTPIQGNFSDWEDRLPLSCFLIAWCLPQLCHTSLTTPRPHRRDGEVFDQSPFWAHVRRAKVPTDDVGQITLRKTYSLVWGRWNSRILSNPVVCRHRVKRERHDTSNGFRILPELSWLLYDAK